MKRKFTLVALGVLLVLGCQQNAGKEASTADSPQPGSASASRSASSEVSFASFNGLVSGKCVSCHGEGGKGGIDLRTYESIMKGGEHGAIVRPGDPSGSVIVQALRGSHGKKKMPPKQPLSENEMELVEAWIKEGAKKA